MADDTIDITDLVEKTRSAFVDWAVAYIYGAEIAIPGLSWVALPVVSEIDQDILRAILNALTKTAEMLVFFENTVMRKATQSKDFLDAVQALDDLPPDVSDADYETAEKARIAAFRNFVTFVN